MHATHLAALLDGVEPGVPETLDLVAGFDDALVPGFARLTGEQRTALSALAGAVASTPLADRVREAVEKVNAGSIADEHLTGLAGARTALLGAVHDALSSRLDSALGRSRDGWAPAAGAPDGSVPGPVPDNLLAGSRAWLRELAIAGWHGVDHDVVALAARTVETLLKAPGLRRLAVLLDGLAAELGASCPVGTTGRVPVRRWADLWSRALLLTHAAGRPDGGPAVAVSGRLLVLGVDVHEHGTAVQMQVHGVFEPVGADPPRLVRTSVSAAKVDTIVGPAVWRLLLRSCPVLLGALAERRVLEVTDLPLLPGGDLVWRDEQARPGEPVDPFATARLRLAEALAPPVPPLERHPVRIAEPVLLEGYQISVRDDGELVLDLGGAGLPLDVARLPTCGPLTPELVRASSACLGLVRWEDGRWLLQPFAVQVSGKRGITQAHTGDWALGPTDPKVAKAEARAGDAVAVLRERAGRLLRR
ncbi:hypothetical protein [Plantactinospora sonchi]|uniref:Uncharacterized protein n=1 Tax=Plantactinospora sonchi TaxID=1544735 RepID=A0ABU7S361_9ACTN